MAMWPYAGSRPSVHMSSWPTEFFSNAQRTCLRDEYHGRHADALCQNEQQVPQLLACLGSADVRKVCQQPHAPRRAVALWLHLWQRPDTVVA